MLGPILQALGRQVGPMAQQLFQVVSPYASKIPPHIYVRVAREASKGVSSWYDSLDYQSRKRIDGAITWVIKDLSGDIVSGMTGLPVGQIVKPLVGKVLDVLHEHRNTPEAEAYIEGELTRKLTQIAGNNLASGSTAGKTGSWIDGRFIEVNPLTHPTSTTILEKFDTYEDYLKWFKDNSPAMKPFCEREFYHSLRYKGT